MNPRFEEYEGQLFRMLDKPEPLTPDAEMPCLVRLIQDDSPMGLYNRDTAYFDVIGKPFVAQKIKENPFYSNTLHAYEKNSLNQDYCIASIHTLEIIGYPVDEGSHWWALYQMMQGKKVHRLCMGRDDWWEFNCAILYHFDNRPLPRITTVDWFLKNFSACEDWQIYEPKPEPKPLLADAKVGDLVKRRDGHWAQIIETSGGVEFQPIEYRYNKRLIAVTINGSYTVYNDYMQDDIVEYQPLAPEGTAEWALQMWKLGNDIRNETGVVLMTDYESEEIKVKHLVDVFPTGWQLYKEPKPKPLLANAKVGDLCKHRNGDWSQIIDTNGTYIQGQPIRTTLKDTKGINRNFCLSGSHFTMQFGGEYDIIHTEPLAPEGSAEWAWQMAKLGIETKCIYGKIRISDSGMIEVCYNGMAYAMPLTQSAENRKYVINKIRECSPDGWQLYEPKIEPPKEPDYVICKRCGGSKSIANSAVSNTAYTNCPKCGGTGYEIREPKPEPAKEQFEVGDWVEWCGGQYMVESAPPQSGGRYDIRSPYDELGCSVYPENITRKLSPSEVILDFGSGIKGTVRICEHDGGCVRVISGDRVIAHIMTDVLEQQIRNLARQLLKAQEEEK